VKLLSRTTRQVTLTCAGLEVLPTAQRSVEELTTSLDSLRELGRGRQERLAIGCLPTIAKHHLPRIILEFVRAAATRSGRQR
jgi:DNA-binding transcriptional LysR family regulator